MMAALQKKEKKHHGLGNLHEFKSWAFYFWPAWLIKLVEPCHSIWWISEIRRRSVEL